MSACVRGFGSCWWAVASMVGLASTWSGCAGGPPARDSSRMDAVGEDDYVFDASWINDGVTVGVSLFSTEQTLRRYQPDGSAAVVRALSSTEGFAGACAAGPDSAAIILDRADRPVVDFYVGGSLSWSQALDGLFGADVRSYQVTCAADGPDDVVLVGATDAAATLSLARWDGADWTVEVTSITAGSLDNWVALTDQRLWIGNFSEVGYRPREGGTTFEMIEASGRLRSRSGGRLTVYDDLYLSATLLSDTSPPRPLGEPSMVGDAVLDGAGRLWVATVLSDGKVETSFGGSSSRYVPYWGQLVLTVDDVEVAHADEPSPSEDDGFALMRPHLLVAGEAVGVRWNGSAYLAPSP